MTRCASSFGGALTVLLSLLVAGCRADEPPEDLDPGPGANDELSPEFDEPLQCDNDCSSIQECINNRCVPGLLPACDRSATLIPTSITLPPTEGIGLRALHAGDLGVGEAHDDLLAWYSDRIVVVPDVDAGASVESLVSFRSPVALVTGELTGDGIPDLAVAGFPDIEIYAGDGSGGFSLAQSLAIGETYPVLAVDADADGRGDLFIRSDMGLLHFELEGDALTEQDPLEVGGPYADHRIGAGGQPELWVGRFGVTVYRGSALEPDSVALPPPKAEIVAIEHAHYTGRFDEDALVVARLDRRNFLVLGDADVIELQTAQVVAHADFDEDGLDDLLIDASVVLGLGGGTSSDPFADACIQEIDGIELVQPTVARRVDRPPYIVLGGPPGPDLVIATLEVD